MAEVGMRSWEAAYKDILSAEYIREKNASRPELFKRAITDDNMHSYIMQYEGKTVGIMRIAPPQDDDSGEDFYELHYIYIHPDYYRQGIGTQAMEFAYDRVRSLGKTAMALWVFAENINSIKFYEKCGFVADGQSREENRGKVMKSIRMRNENI